MIWEEVSDHSLKIEFKIDGYPGTTIKYTLTECPSEMIFDLYEPEQSSVALGDHYTVPTVEPPNKIYQGPIRDNEVLLVNIPNGFNYYVYSSKLLKTDHHDPAFQLAIDNKTKIPNDQGLICGKSFTTRLISLNASFTEFVPLGEVGEANLSIYSCEEQIFSRQFSSDEIGPTWSLKTDFYNEKLGKNYQTWSFTLESDDFLLLDCEISFTTYDPYSISPIIEISNDDGWVIARNHINLASSYANTVNAIYEIPSLPSGQYYILCRNPRVQVKIYRRAEIGNQISGFNLFFGIFLFVGLIDLWFRHKGKIEKDL